jgi:uncharacterized membrane protein HdeD (DUF308 family)
MEMILLGAIALFSTLASSPISGLATGWILLGAGILQLANTGGTGHRGHTSWRLATALPDLIPGLYLLSDRAAGPTALTLAISLALLFGAGTRFFAIFEANLRHKRWPALEALCCSLLAMLLLTSLPPNGLWYIGFAFALGLMVRGWSRVMVTAAFRSDVLAAV